MARDLPQKDAVKYGRGRCEQGFPGAFSAAPLVPEQRGGWPLETERLRLRPYQVRDFDAVRELTADPETFRYSERGPMSREESWSRLLHNIGHWAALGYGLFAVEDKATGQFVGEAGLATFERALGFGDVPEASWTIAAAFQGRGYATEAARASLDWVQKKLGTDRSICLVHAGNRQSLRVAQKLGYAPIAHLEYRGYPAVLHERSRGTRPAEPG